jgi:hypothetical protein
MSICLEETQILILFQIAREISLRSQAKDHRSRNPFSTVVRSRTFSNAQKITDSLTGLQKQLCSAIVNFLFLVLITSHRVLLRNFCSIFITRLIHNFYMLSV